MNVFFYGLFMDETLLAAKGIEPSEVNLGVVRGYALRIGERATLTRCQGGRTYGSVMRIAAGEVAELYSEESVADYVPETVTVELMDGARVEASSYILPAGKVSGTNRKYAKSLLALATRLDFPDAYLDEIRLAMQ